MLAGHAMALLGVPMRRVIRVLREQREQRYGLLRGWFHGRRRQRRRNGRGAPGQLTLPDAVAGRRLNDLLAELLTGTSALRAIALRSRAGARAIGDDTVLQGGETLVLSGKTRALAHAEHVLAA